MLRKLSSQGQVNTMFKGKLSATVFNLILQPPNGGKFHLAILIVKGVQVIHHFKGHWIVFLMVLYFIIFANLSEKGVYRDNYNLPKLRLMVSKLLWSTKFQWLVFMKSMNKRIQTIQNSPKLVQWDKKRK